MIDSCSRAFLLSTVDYAWPGIVAAAELHRLIQCIETRIEGLLWRSEFAITACMDAYTLCDGDSSMPHLYLHHGLRAVLTSPGRRLAHLYAISLYIPHDIAKDWLQTTSSHASSRYPMPNTQSICSPAKPPTVGTHHLSERSSRRDCLRGHCGAAALPRS